MTMTHNNPQLAKLTLLGVGLALGLATLAGCRGEREDAPPRQFFPDLDDAPKWKPQDHSEFFADGRTMRLPPAGTVPFGTQGFRSEEPWAKKFDKQADDLLKADPAFYQGKAADGTYLAKAPIAFTKEDLLRGQERFNIYCAACHNYSGDGQGTVGVMWSYPVPNFHDDIYVDPKNEKSRDGYLFHIARDGVWSPDGAQNKMPAYAHAIGYDDAWRIIAYIRVLQSTRRGTLEDVPADKRDEMKKLMDQKAAASAAAAPAATPAPAPATGGAK
jgi:mono/diheme cytochrome c family protein